MKACLLLLAALACLSGALAQNGQLQPGVYVIQLQSRPSCPDSRNGYLTGFSGSNRLGLTPTYPSNWFGYWTVRNGADFNVLNKPINIQNYGKAQTRQPSWLWQFNPNNPVCKENVPVTLSRTAPTLDQRWFITPKPSVSALDQFYIMKNSNTCPYRFMGFSRTQCSAQPSTSFDGIPLAPTFIFTIVSPTAPAVQGGFVAADNKLKVYVALPEGRAPFTFELQGRLKGTTSIRLTTKGPGTKDPEDPSLVIFSFPVFQAGKEYEFRARASNAVDISAWGPWESVVAEPGRK